LRNNSTGRVLFGSVGARDTPHYKALLTGEVAFAEKTGNLMQLIGWMTSKWVIAHDSGDLPTEVTLANQVFELGLRETSPTSLGIAHGVQVLTRYLLGDLAGAEEHFTAGLKFFYDPGLRQYPGGVVGTFGYASFTAWALGRADLPRGPNVGVRSDWLPERTGFELRFR
jgi:hypothetical protein